MYLKDFIPDDWLTCDQIFALYLMHVGSKVKPKFYQAVTAFIDLFRSCMNIYGYDMKKNFKVFVWDHKQDFTASEDGFLIPKIANIFNFTFLPT